MEDYLRFVLFWCVMLSLIAVGTAWAFCAGLYEIFPATCHPLLAFAASVVRSVRHFVGW